MNTLVKFITDEDGDEHTSKDWHYVIDSSGSDMALCTSEVFGSGEGAAEFKTKTTKKGGITCEDCLVIIKQVKSIKI
jgi:hypothetical protein